MQSELHVTAKLLRLYRGREIAFLGVREAIPGFWRGKQAWR